ncbi:MAG: hypothetical protein WDW38_010322 [Sanguina aurantia]
MSRVITSAEGAFSDWRQARALPDFIPRAVDALVPASSCARQCGAGASGGGAGHGGRRDARRRAGRDAGNFWKQVGNVEAFSNVSVSSQVDGQLKSLGFVPGAHVRKGELLAQIDPRPLQSQLDQAKGNLARDNANLLKAKADMARYVPLLANGYVAQADVDTYKNNLGVAAAAIQSDRAAVELAQTQLGFTRILAPFDGVLGAPLVYPGAR